VSAHPILKQKNNGGNKMANEFKTRENSSGYRQYNSGDGWAYTHRTVAEKAYGEIPDGYQVHHINSNKLDNRPENLQVLSREQHRQIHHGNNNNSMSDLVTLMYLSQNSEQITNTVKQIADSYTKVIEQVSEDLNRALSSLFKQ
jgi:hypothetical protein